MTAIDWNAVRRALDAVAGRAPSPTQAATRPPEPRFVPPPRVEATLPEQPLDEFREFKWE
jgi:hypothetical protein